VKAISLHQPWASLVAAGYKRIETRSWRTRHRGMLLICATKIPVISPERWGALREQYWRLPEAPPAGAALAIAELVECRPMVEDDEAAACCDIYQGAVAWVLRDIRQIEPVAVRGRQGIYEVRWP